MVPVNASSEASEGVSESGERNAQRGASEGGNEGGERNAQRGASEGLHEGGERNEIADETPVFVVGGDRLRHLRDGAEAYPAMLAAIDEGRREVLLEMYWIGADDVGRAFLGALTRRAAAGLVVRVIFDAVGSAGLPSGFWAPLIEAGGEVVSFGPVRPGHRRFDLRRVLFRDHRKLLVVDGAIAFTGGINLAQAWLPVAEGGLGWRDDAVELRGETALVFRRLFFESWTRCGRQAPKVGPRPAQATRRGVSVLSNRVHEKPDRAIRRRYLLSIRRARSSVDIAAAYFLPGPLFMHALRAAARRGVHVRLLVPAHSDLRLVALASAHAIGELLEDGVEVYAYQPRMLHSKTAVIDRRIAIVGSHNLDTFSWRFNTEGNLLIEDAGFGEALARSFERDLEDAVMLGADAWKKRPLTNRWLSWAAWLARGFL